MKNSWSSLSITDFLICALLLFAVNVSMALDSGIVRTWRKGPLQNVHAVVEEQSTLIVRGAAPTTEEQFHELQKHGFKKILIFKMDTQGEVADEIATLKSRGYKSSDVLHIPMEWKDVDEIRPLCEMTVQALRFLAAQERAHKKTYFHCTVGEDRTGMLAALYLLATGRANDAESVFQEQMCRFGYEAGNPKKPYRTVVAPIRQTLTPLYLRLAEKIQEQGLSGEALCDGQDWDDVLVSPLSSDFQCKASDLAKAAQ